MLTIYGKRRSLAGFVPFGRKNKELAKLATEQCFFMSARSYASNQFPDPVVLKDGSLVHKPSTW
jgi:hypothetical protein